MPHVQYAVPIHYGEATSQQKDSKVITFGHSRCKMSAMTDKPITIDDTDRQLIALLRDDARQPVSALAARLRVARGTVVNRLRRLEASGVISGYTVRLRPESEGHRIRAWMGIAVEGNANDVVLRALRGEPAIATLHATNGRWDFMAELRADTLEAFDRALNRIRAIDGITTTETSILLSTHKV
jgi:DNA-binding Lrp family transcriptional regulator